MDLTNRKKEHKISIILEDTVVEGHETVSVDVLIDGLSIAEGETDYEKYYTGSFENIPQSLRLLSAIMTGLGSV